MKKIWVWVVIVVVCVLGIRAINNVEPAKAAPSDKFSPDVVAELKSAISITDDYLENDIDAYQARMRLESISDNISEKEDANSYDIGATSYLLGIRIRLIGDIDQKDIEEIKEYRNNLYDYLYTGKYK